LVRLSRHTMKCNEPAKIQANY